MGSKAEEILKRLMRAYDVHDEGALAVQMGKDQSTLRVWKSRDAVPLLVLRDASKATGYALEWLQLDTETPEPNRATPDNTGNMVVLSERENRLLTAYREVPEAMRTTAESTVAALAAKARPARELRERTAQHYVEEPVFARATKRLTEAALTSARDIDVSLSYPDNSDTTRFRAGTSLTRKPLLPLSEGGQRKPMTLALRVGTQSEVTYEVIPRFLGDAGAGRSANGGHVDGMDQAGELAFAWDWLRQNMSHTSGQLASIRVRGDSMSPTLIDGETIIIDTAVRRVDSPGIYVIDMDGDRLVKRVDRKLDKSLVVKSDNVAYEPETLPAGRAHELGVLGRMVWPRTR